MQNGHCTTDDDIILGSLVQIFAIRKDKSTIKAGKPKYGYPAR